MEKTHQVVWDVVLEYGRIEWQDTLKNLQKSLNVAYQDVLDELDSVWCVKQLIATRSNLMVTWKERPWIGIIS